MLNKDVKKVLFTEEEISNRCKELAAQIDRDFNTDRDLVLVGILKGSVPFMAELMKHIERDVQIDFLIAKSYQGRESTGDIQILKDLDNSVKDKDVLLVEDIVDTGLTMRRVKSMMYDKGANEVRIATLLDKPSRRTVDIKAEYIGFEIENEFVIGFGMDFDEKYRNLPYVGVIKDELY